MRAWIVLEWNQASGQPSVMVEELYNRREVAELVASEAHEHNRENGRREQFTVAEVDVDPPVGGAA